MKTMYLAGPITGKYNKNAEAFNRAGEYWNKRGWIVLNPLNYTGKDEKFIMLQEIRDLLLRADAIFMLKEWESSYGARIEYLFAKKFKISIYYEHGLEYE